MVSAVDKRFKSLGFNVGIPSLVFVRSLSRDCMLVVEGGRVKGFADIVTHSIRQGICRTVE